MTNSTLTFKLFSSFIKKIKKMNNKIEKKSYFQALLQDSLRPCGTVARHGTIAQYNI